MELVWWAEGYNESFHSRELLSRPIFERNFSPNLVTLEFPPSCFVVLGADGFIVHVEAVIVCGVHVICLKVTEKLTLKTTVLIIFIGKFAIHMLRVCD